LGERKERRILASADPPDQTARSAPTARPADLHFGGHRAYHAHKHPHHFSPPDVRALPAAPPSAPAGAAARSLADFRAKPRKQHFTAPNCQRAVREPPPGMQTVVTLPPPAGRSSQKFAFCLVCVTVPPAGVPAGRWVAPPRRGKRASPPRIPWVSERPKNLRRRETCPRVDEHRSRPSLTQPHYAGALSRRSHWALIRGRCPSSASAAHC
jgi:hypothetical protein